MHPEVQCRLASTSSQEDGPSREKLRAIPFRTTMEQARDAYESHHSSNLLLAKPSADALKLKDSFLPFWLVNADVQVRWVGGQQRVNVCVCVDVCVNVNVDVQVC
jgi:hypothetical protein